MKHRKRIYESVQYVRFPSERNSSIKLFIFLPEKFCERNKKMSQEKASFSHESNRKKVCAGCAKKIIFNSEKPNNYSINKNRNWLIKRSLLPMQDFQLVFVQVVA